MENQASPEKVRKVDPRIARTKQLLFQSLRQLLGEQCFKDITVQDILDRASINRATFYAHFDDKDALLNSILGTLFEQSLHKRLAPNSTPCEQNFDALVLALCDFLGQMRRCSKLATVQGNPHVEMAIKPPVSRVISQWFASQGREEAETEIAAATLGWAMVGAAIRWNLSQDSTFMPAEDFLAQLKVLLRPSIDFLLDPAALTASPAFDRIKRSSPPVYMDEAGMI